MKLFYYNENEKQELVGSVMGIVYTDIVGKMGRELHGFSFL